MSKNAIPMIMLSGILASMAVAISAGGSGISAGPLKKGAYLPLPSKVKHKSPWNIDWFGSANNVTFGGGAMTVTYAAGKYGGASGVGIRARPFGAFPADSATIGCSIFVPSNFAFTKGGKLGPGLCIGPKLGECATGGDWGKDTGSARISFDDDGSAVAYIYFPRQVGKQGPGYAAEVQAADTAKGNKLFKKHSGSLKLRRGAWNEVSIRVVLGAPGGTGSVTLNVNGSSFTVGVKWRNSSTVRISSVLFATFFGGSSGDYAPKTTQKLMYKNFWTSN